MRRFFRVSRPIARLFYFMNSGLSKEDRGQRDNLYGGLKDGFRPMAPFRWDLGENKSLLEIPVTTMPIARLPIHGSYLLYLAKFSEFAADTYFRTSLLLYKLTGGSPSFLLHPTDFLGCEDVPELSYFPAMDQPGDVKLAQMRKFLTRLTKGFDVVSMETQAERLNSAAQPLKRLDTLQENLAT